MSDSPSHAHFQGTNQAPLCDPWLFWTNQEALHKYLGGSEFILTALLYNAKLCDPNVLKVIPTQVSNVQYLF